jgi:GT2 family glycosyltransferase
MLTKYYPKVLFIQSKINLGFSKANNIAFKASTGDVLLFLNPDTECENNSLLTLYHNYKELPNAGIAGPKLLNTDRTVQTSCIQSFPNILNQFLDSNLLRKLFPNSRLWGNYHLFSQRAEPVEVDAMSGACLMIHKKLFKKIGMFGTEYFMYSEDIDLCYKVKSAGYQNYFVPNATVVHHGGVSSDQVESSTFSAVMMLESRLRFFRKHNSVCYSHLYRFAILTSSLIRIILLTVQIPIYSLAGNRHALNNKLIKWIARLKWCFGYTRWAGHH